MRMTAHEEEGEDEHMISPPAPQGTLHSSRPIDRRGFASLAVVLGLSNSADAVETLAFGFVISSYRKADGAMLDSSPFVSGAMGASIFTGMLLGGLVGGGALSQRYGRRSVLLWSLLINAVSGICSGTLAPHFGEDELKALFFFRLCSGVGVGSAIPVSFALASELTPPSAHALIVNILAVFWTLGTIYISLLASILLKHDDFIQKKWRWFLILAALPALLSLLLTHRCVPESVRGRKIRARHEDPAEIAKKMAKLSDDEEIGFLTGTNAAARGGDAGDEADQEIARRWCPFSLTYEPLTSSSIISSDDDKEEREMEENENDGEIDNRPPTLTSSSILTTTTRANEFAPPPLLPPITNNRKPTEAAAAVILATNVVTRPATSFSSYAKFLATWCRDCRLAIAKDPSSSSSSSNAGILPPARSSLTLVSFLWFCLGFSTFGVFSWINDVFKHAGFAEDDSFLVSLLFSAAALPGNMLSTCLLGRSGRFPLLTASMAASAACALFFSWSARHGGQSVPPSHLPLVLSACAFSALSTCSWSALEVLSAENFPLKTRTLSLALATAAGRLGSICANFVNAALIAWGGEQVLYAAALVLIAGCLARLLC